jgi:hypothetical protein
VSVLVAPASGGRLDYDPASGRFVALDRAQARKRQTAERRQARRLARLLDSDSADGHAGLLTTLYRHGKQVDVLPKLRRGMVLGAGWPTFCFEAAFEYAARHADAPGLSLVHGYVTEHELLWAHGWVELDPEGVTFDPTTGRWYERASFSEVLRARPLAVYTAAQAMARHDAEGHPGPWSEVKALNARLLAARLDQIAAANRSSGRG